MKRSCITLAIAGAFSLSACAGESGADSESSSTTDEVAVEESETASSACTVENMQEKALELSGKVQGLASDPAKLQEVTKKMQEIQEKMQNAASDGSYSTQEACDAYDELLEAVN